MNNDEVYTAQRLLKIFNSSKNTVGFYLGYYERQNQTSPKYFKRKMAMLKTKTTPEIGFLERLAIDIKQDLFAVATMYKKKDQAFDTPHDSLETLIRAVAVDESAGPGIRKQATVLLQWLTKP